jgi:hypothetical protein
MMRKLKILNPVYGSYSKSSEFRNFFHGVCGQCTSRYPVKEIVSKSNKNISIFFVNTILMPCFAPNENSCTALQCSGICKMRRRFAKKLIIKSDHKSLSGFLLFHLLDQDKSPFFGKLLFYWFWIFVFYRESLPHGSSLPRHGQRSKSRERWLINYIW